jgi:hypothetical protein
MRGETRDTQARWQNLKTLARNHCIQWCKIQGGKPDFDDLKFLECMENKNVPRCWGPFAKCMLTGKFTQPEGILAGDCGKDTCKCDFEPEC